MLNREQIRAFIAIELPDELKAALRDFQSGLLGPKSYCARWVKPESIHLTLKFLGDVDLHLIEKVKSRLETEVKLCTSFLLKTGETGFFPNRERARVFWLGLEGDTHKLLQLQNAIDGAMSRLGFPKESRPFTAHLTLARFKDGCSTVEKQAFADLVENVKLRPSCQIKVNAVSLMSSKLEPKGAIYTRLAGYSMRDAL